MTISLFLLFFFLISGFAKVTTQNARLTSNHWYFTEFQLQGKPSVLMSQADFRLGSAGLDFLDTFSEYDRHTAICSGHAGGTRVNYPSATNNSFVLGPYGSSSGSCSNYTGNWINPVSMGIDVDYQIMWSQYDTPISYSVSQNGNLISLRLDFLDESWAIYHNQVLSSTDFSTTDIIRLHNNPVDQMVILDGVDLFDDLSVSVFNPNGEILISRTVYDSRSGLNVQGLSSDVYFLKFSASSNSQMLKFVVR